MLGYLGLGVIYGIVASLLLGTGSFIMIHTSIKQGFWKAFVFLLGLNVIDPIIAVVSYYLISYIVHGIPIINITLRGHVAATISVVVGAFMIINKVSITNSVSQVYDGFGYIYVFIKGCIIQTANVFSWIMGMVVASYFILHHNPYGFIGFITGVFTVVLITDIVKIYYAQKILKKISPSVVNTIQRTIGCIVICIGMGVRYKTNICGDNPALCIQKTQSQLQDFFDKTSTHELGK